MFRPRRVAETSGTSGASRGVGAPRRPATRWIVTAAVSTSMLALTVTAGCASTIDGTPVAAPGAAPVEPPTSVRPAPTPPLPPSQRPGPGTAVALPPDANGYVFIETKSGRTRCQISEQSVGCEAEFTNSPILDEEPANGVSISSDGDVNWVVGNLGDIPVVTIDYRTYTALGWTIRATVDGTRFSNDRTGHGMYVSIEKVETF